MSRVPLETTLYVSTYSRALRHDRWVVQRCRVKIPVQLQDRPQRGSRGTAKACIEKVPERLKAEDKMSQCTISCKSETLILSGKPKG